ncbi:MAG: transposase [Verrucomicrobia bacterium]|nr:transposase [Verrucomicrobiota bacterium]MBS0646955.1 transposase [Verrucomicrobiota bacterium]
MPKNEAIGIDVGLKHFATLSNSEEIANARFFKKGEKELAKAQRKLSKLKKGTKERKKQGKKVAKIQEHIGNQRKDFCCDYSHA